MCLVCRGLGSEGRGMSCGDQLSSGVVGNWAFSGTEQTYDSTPAWAMESAVQDVEGTAQCTCRLV